MKRLIGFANIVIVLVYFSTPVWAKQTTHTLSDLVTQAASKAEQNSPKFNIYGLKKVTHSKEYVEFLFDKALDILGDASHMSLGQLKTNGFLGIKWSDLSPKEQMTINTTAEVVEGVFEYVEIAAILALLDATVEVNPQTTRPTFRMDGVFVAGENSGLAQVSSKEIIYLLDSLYAANESLAREKISKLRLFHVDGRVNEQDMATFLEMVPWEKDILMEFLGDHVIGIDVIGIEHDKAVLPGDIIISFSNGPKLYLVPSARKYAYGQRPYIAR